MELNQIRKNLIVVVSESKMLGNDPGAITKIVAQPGAVVDSIFKTTGKSTTKAVGSLTTVLCEATTKPHTQLRYNNKPVCFEEISSLRLAKDWEKEHYRKGEYQTEVTFEEVT